MQAVDIALEYSKSNEWQVRANAAVALAEVGGPAALERLCELASEDAERAVRKEAHTALSKLDDDAARGVLVEAIEKEPNSDLRVHVMRLLGGNGRLSDTAVRALARAAARDSDREVQRTAVEVLSQAEERGSGWWQSLWNALSSNQDPERRLKAIELATSRLTGSNELDVTSLTADEYNRLGELKRAGVTISRIRGSLFGRLRHAWEAWAAAKWRNPFHTRLRGLVVTAVLPLVVLGIVTLLANVTLDNTQMAGFTALTMLAAAIAVIVIPFVWRPMSLSLDRTAGMICELAWMTVVLGVVSFGISLLSLLLAGELNLTLAFVIAVVITAVLTLQRAASQLSYRLVGSLGWTESVQTTVATFAGFSALILVVVGLALVYGDAEAGTWALLFFAAMPAVGALAVTAARTDGALKDKAPVSGRRLRTAICVGLCLPALLTLAAVLAGHQARQVLSRDLNLPGQLDSARDHKFTIGVGTDTPFKLDFGQVVTLQAEPRQLGEMLKMRLGFPSSGTPEIQVDVPMPIGPMYLSAGTHRLRIDPSFDDLPAPERMQIDQAAARAAAYLARGARWSAADVPNVEGITVSIRTNVRGVTSDELKRAEAMRERLLLQLQRSTGSARQPGAYAVLHKDDETFSAGSVVRSIAETRAGQVAKRLWALVDGASTTGVILGEPLRTSLVELGSRPTPDDLRDADAYRKVFSERSADVHVETALGRELAKGSDTNALALLETAGEWLEASNTENALKGSYFIYSGDPSEAIVRPGSIVRGVSWREGDDAGFELVDGEGVRGEAGSAGGESRLFYWLAKADTILQGRAWPVRDAALAAQLRERYPIISSGSQMRSVQVAAGASPPPAPTRIEPTSFIGRLSPSEILLQAGKWIESFGVSLSAQTAPPVFKDYFIVAEAKEFVGLGSIVQGHEWDDDGLPEMKIVYGWARTDSPNNRDTHYIDARSLTHLGPNLPAGAVRLADQLRSVSPGERVQRKIDHLGR